MPRVGLAYRPANKWVIRSGAGWFADVEHLNTFTILANMPPFGSSQQFDAVTDPGKTVTVTANQTEYRIATRQFRPGSPIAAAAGRRSSPRTHSAFSHSRRQFFAYEA